MRLFLLNSSSFLPPPIQFWNWRWTHLYSNSSSSSSSHSLSLSLSLIQNSVADWKLVPELVNNTNEAYVREHETQLNESEYTPVFVAMLGLMHAVNADAGQAPGMMLYSSLAYTAASAFAGFPFYVPAAIWRYGAFALGLKKIFEAKNF